MYGYYGKLYSVVNTYLLGCVTQLFPSLTLLRFGLPCSQRGAVQLGTIRKDLPLFHGPHRADVGHVKLQWRDADVSIGNDR